MNNDHDTTTPMPAVFTMPGFQGRVIAQIGPLTVIEAELEGEIPAHAATSDEFAYVLSGQVEVQVEERQLILGPGDHLHVAVGEDHAVRALAPARLLLIGAAGDKTSPPEAASQGWAI